MNLFASSLPSTLGEALLFAAIGTLLGTLHFAALEWNTRLFLRPGGGGWGVIVQLLRMGLTATGLVACAWNGAMPLVAALAGLLLARQVVLRHAGPPGGAAR